ncbi:hypothetical protein CDAR_608541 [Caerostris darwini]|uniref:Uncharacterized protein n=1 Tax=Caerostris darwini TaxID=1538125 RepID=A0AAV4WMV0_9ARAC|nr:hypothetical protein CDAR_608541 [Caerostris darwini]
MTTREIITVGKAGLGPNAPSGNQRLMASWLCSISRPRGKRGELLWSVLLYSASSLGAQETNPLQFNIHQTFTNPSKSNAIMTPSRILFLSIPETRTVSTLPETRSIIMTSLDESRTRFSLGARHAVPDSLTY